MMPLRLLSLVLLLSVFSGCSTLKGWFTAQGQKLNQAQSLYDAGHPLGASALAVEALVLEPEYKEARTLLDKSFGPGQDEFRSSESRWTVSSDPTRWDRLYELYTWQTTLARDGASISPRFHVEPVDDKREVAARGASQYHWDLAVGLLEAGPGPRQARKALEEGKKAQSYSDSLPGLSAWMDSVREAATQKLMVVPFFAEGPAKLGPVAGPLASLISRKLAEGDLPELTTIFPSDRLVTLPGGGLARLGYVSQPDAAVLAAQAGQNLLLMGQMTRIHYQEPKLSAKTEARERKAVLVSPEFPQGKEKIYRAAVTTKRWTSSIVLTASFAVIEVETGRDLISAVREAKTSDEKTETSFTGDREALTADDLRALDQRSTLAEADELWSLALESLADQVARVVIDALR